MLDFHACGIGRWCTCRDTLKKASHLAKTPPWHRKMVYLPRHTQKGHLAKTPPWGIKKLCTASRA